MNGQLKVLKLPTAPIMQLGKAPGHLDQDQRTAWDEIVAKCEKYELLRCDRLFLEVTAQMLSGHRASDSDKVTYRRSLNSALLKMGVPLKSRRVLMA